MARSTTPTCCLTLPLRLEKWQEDKLDKRFEIARQIYNTLLRAERKKLRQLEQTREYREIQTGLSRLYEQKADKSPEFKQLANRRTALLKQAGFSEYAFKDDMKWYYKHFKQNIASGVAVHGIAPNVWAAFEKLLYGKGKFVHFKKRGSVNSVRGASVSGKSGGGEIIFRDTYIEWNRLKLPIKSNRDNAYETEMLQNRVKYVRIMRKPGKHRTRWYTQLVLEGIPATKRDSKTGAPVHSIGHGTVGIDIGPQTIAYVSAEKVELKELADRVQNIEQQKRTLQRKMDRSRRATNPDNYAPDGTIKKGVKLTHNRSGRYSRLQRKLAYLQHRQADIRKQQHTQMANELLSLGDTFIVEDMSWESLTHRAKETSISPKTGKYKRKKRFGKSVANKAPAMLITILKQKCVSCGLPGVIEVSTMLRASQYNHITNTYQKKSLSQRWNIMPDGRRVQRDLYSAFLLQHVTVQRDGFDSEQLHKDYESFMVLHDQVINKLMSASKTITSMGIRRSIS